jgi:hypothetical protein
VIFDLQITRLIEIQRATVFMPITEEAEQGTRQRKGEGAEQRSQIRGLFKPFLHKHYEQKDLRPAGGAGQGTCHSVTAKGSHLLLTGAKSTTFEIWIWITAVAASSDITAQSD